MKSILEYLNEGYEGQYYRGLAIGPFKTKEIINFDHSLKYSSNRINDFIDVYFNTIGEDEINSLLGEQRFLYYFKKCIGYARAWLDPNEVSFRKKDIIAIKEYVEKRLNKTLDKWEDKLKDEIYDKSDQPKDEKELFDYYVDHNLEGKYKQYKDFIGKVVKFKVKNYNGGNDGPYFYRRYFRENDLFRKDMTLYTFVLWADKKLNFMFVTDDNFNVLYDWSDKITSEDLSYDDFSNMKLATDEEAKKFAKAFKSSILDKHLSKKPFQSRFMPEEISIPLLFTNCPIKLPDDIEL